MAKRRRSESGQPSGAESLAFSVKALRAHMSTLRNWNGTRPNLLGGQSKGAGKERKIGTKNITSRHVLICMTQLFTHLFSFLLLAISICKYFQAKKRIRYFKQRTANAHLADNEGA